MVSKATVICCLTALLIEASLANCEEKSCASDVPDAVQAESLLQVRQQTQPEKPKWKQHKAQEDNLVQEEQPTQMETGDGDGDGDSSSNLYDNGDGDADNAEEGTTGSPQTTGAPKSGGDGDDNDDTGDNENAGDNDEEGTTGSPQSATHAPTLATEEKVETVSVEEAVQAEKDRQSAEERAKKKMKEAQEAMNQLQEKKVVAEQAVSAVAAERKAQQEGAVNELKDSEKALSKALEEKQTADKIAREKADAETTAIEKLVKVAEKVVQKVAAGAVSNETLESEMVDVAKDAALPEEKATVHSTESKTKTKKGAKQ